MKNLLTSALVAAPLVTGGGCSCAAPAAAAPRIITVEVLALDLRVCGRCCDTQKNVEEAVRLAGSSLAPMGVELRVTETVVTSEETGGPTSLCVVSDRPD